MSVAMAASGYAARSACTTATYDRPCEGDSPELCVEHSIDERRWVSDEVAGSDVKDRVLAGSRSE